MKSLFSILTLALGLTVASASPAAARGSIPYGTQHSLTFIADLGGVGRQQQDVALCHHTVRNHVAFLGYWVRSQGYVKSLTGCEGNSYLRFQDGEFAALQAAGIIPADLPMTARMSAQTIMVGFGWLILLGIGAFFKVLQFLLHGRKRVYRAVLWPRKCCQPCASSRNQMAISTARKKMRSALLTRKSSASA